MCSSLIDLSAATEIRWKLLPNGVSLRTCKNCSTSFGSAESLLSSKLLVRGGGATLFSELIIPHLEKHVFHNRFVDRIGVNTLELTDVEPGIVYIE
jgi:hypothetical protein